MTSQWSFLDSGCMEIGEVDFIAARARTQCPYQSKISVHVYIWIRLSSLYGK